MSRNPSSDRWTTAGFMALSGAALLIATLAVAFYYGPNYNLAFLFTAVAALIALIGLSGPAAAARQLAANPVTTGAAVLTLCCLAVQHALASISPETSIAGAWQLAVAPLSFLAFSVLGARLRQLGRAPEWGLGLPWSLVWLAVGIAVYRLLADGQRPFDPLSDASALACLLYLAWVPWMHETLDARGPTSRWYLALAGSLLLLITLFATGSRAGIGLVALALICWLVLSLRGRLPIPRVGALAGVAVVAALIAYQASTSLQTSLTETVVADASTSQRLLLASAALEAYGQGSLHGSGPLTFNLLYGALRTPEDQTSGGAFVHNDYLQLLVEGGPWLLWPLLLLALVSGFQVVVGLLRPESSWRRGRFGGWLALALACAHAVLNFIVYTPALAFAMGGVLAWTLAPTAAAIAPAAATVRARLGWSLALLLALLLLGLFLVEVMALAVFSGQPDLLGSARYRSSPQAQLSFARAVLRVLPDRGLPRLVLALNAEQAGREAARRGAGDELVAAFNRALAEYRKLRLADPWNTDALERYARFLALRESAAVQRLLPSPPLPSGLIALQPQEDPEQLLIDALRRNPRSLTALGALVGLYDQHGRSVEAFQRIKAHFGAWMPHHLSRRPRSARQWLRELERRAMLADDELWVGRVRAQAQQLGPDAEPEPPRIWFQRWRQASRRLAAEGS